MDKLKLKEICDTVSDNLQSDLATIYKSHVDEYKSDGELDQAAYQASILFTCTDYINKYVYEVLCKALNESE